LTHDEAARIAEQIAKTIPRKIACVVAVEQNPMNSTWEIKMDEPRTDDGGRGIFLWIKSPRDWIRLQHEWSARNVKRENT
jgi:hypothetical protein